MLVCEAINHRPPSDRKEIHILRKDSVIEMKKEDSFIDDSNTETWRNLAKSLLARTWRLIWVFPELIQLSKRLIGFSVDRPQWVSACCDKNPNDFEKQIALSEAA